MRRVCGLWFDCLLSCFALYGQKTSYDWLVYESNTMQIQILKENAFDGVHWVLMENLGQLIRSLRKERRLTQQMLAEQYGMSRATISGIENNTMPEIGIRKVEAILSGFGYELTASPRQTSRPTLDSLKTAGFHD